jgi:shikimate kinase
MLVGLAMAGKSAVMHSLASALDLVPDAKKVHIHKINPKAQSLG